MSSIVWGTHLGSGKHAGAGNAILIKDVKFESYFCKIERHTARIGNLDSKVAFGYDHISCHVGGPPQREH
jgi:hypothetical protein